MTLIVVKKVWNWLKHFWYVPILFLVLIFTLLFGWKRNQALIDIINLSTESYKKQLDVINETHKKEISKREELIVEYQQQISKFEEEYKFKLGDLEEGKQKEVEELVKVHKQNPSTLADEMKKLFDL